MNNDSIVNRAGTIVKKPDTGAKPARRTSRTRPAPDDESALVANGLSRADAAWPTIEAILRVVPASRWAFARVAPDGDLNHLLPSPAGEPDAAVLQGELRRQRLKVKAGPRIAAVLGPLDEFESGITLLFADARATFGILTLLRTAELGPFTSSEVSMLTFALTAASDQLSALRLQAPEQTSLARGPTGEAHATSAEPPEAAFYVLDRNMEIVLAWTSEDQRRIALTGLRTRIADHLPAVLEESVRELTAAWGIDPATLGAGIARPVPFLVVRMQPMSGPTGLFIGVRIDRFHAPNSLTGAASRFHISPRELQVLALLLDGAHLDEIGSRLHITSSTVQDHIRSMVEKTESRNRTELVARVLGWECTPASPPV